MVEQEQGTSSYSAETMVNDSQPRSKPSVVSGTTSRRKRGRPCKMNDLRYLPGFFKIYLPKHNSKQLVIPRDFVKNFNGKIFKTGKLRNLQGKIWKGELEQAGCKLLIKKGWEDFAADNSLTRGEFLTFSYNGNVTFTVEIFSINGCKKRETTATNAGQPRVTKNVPNSIRFNKVYNGCLYDLLIPARIFKTYKIVPPKLNSSETILLRNQRGYTQEVKIWQRVDRVALSHGWREYQIENNIDKGDKCEFEVIVGEGRKIKEIVLLQVHTSKAKNR